MDVIVSLLARNGYLPHGYCFTWRPELLWSMVGADAVIAAAYFSIPIGIISFVRQRDEPALKPLAWLFSAFIFACGVTHVLGIWTIWQPDYGAQALSKVITAVVSMATALMLWRLIPRALKIPSVHALQTVIGSLEAEVRRRRSVEESLVDSEQSLAVTLASIDAGFIATDREGLVTRMNAVAERVTGWREADAVGRMYWDVFSHDVRPEADLRRNPVDLMLERGITVDTVQYLTAVGRDGQRTALEVRAAPTHSGDGAVRGLAMVFRDMTGPMQAAVQASRLAAIVESSNDAIIGKTLDGRITSWNGAATTMFGYSAEEAIGQPVQMLLIPEGRQHEEMRIVADLARGAAPAFDTVRRAKDGRMVDVSITISPVRDARGTIVGAAKIARDLTGQRAAEAENLRIQEASRLKSQFLANMSHELRTPLNAIIGFAELLQRGAVDPASPKHAQFLGHIGTSGRHLLQLINDVLDLSKVESGKFEFFPEPVDLPRLVGEVLDVLHTAIQRKEIGVVVDIDPALDDLVLDPARLKQVLFNYLSNALKFTPDGGRVTVRARPEGPAHFRLEVEDTGIGIAPQDLDRLFVEFQQLDAGYSKQHQGTGLGLALTRRLVQAQGGEVGVRSEIGRGSCFHLVRGRVINADAASATPPRWLVIDGEGMGQHYIVNALGAAGFEVDAASTAAQARQRSQVHTYDAITLDLLLPDQPGLGLLADLRERLPARHAPVVGVTMPADAGHSVRFAITDVLSKPLRSAEVVAAMARFRGPTPHVMRVMVVDDDPTALALMQATLDAMDIRTICLADGRSALAQLDEHRPDALVLDLMMPGFDGFEVLDALARLPAWRHLPVYIWTSMILTEAEYTQLSGSARAILGKGGGALDAMMEALRSWRPAREDLPGEALP